MHMSVEVTVTNTTVVQFASQISGTLALHDVTYCGTQQIDESSARCLKLHRIKLLVATNPCKMFGCFQHSAH
ncbi:hypothetical protein BRADI_4g32135v3 [Brachypodium distachyon]|uniref:Uncharacterized protein n=1 Tax=Brachypodium distachyon TaxID=15368 RepID=A0A0Q3PM60_BRADI|nr:hypothetical protein BRADI_4g32135v3 [Brachypodium distachyon]